MRLCTDSGRIFAVPAKSVRTHQYSCLQLVKPSLKCRQDSVHYHVLRSKRRRCEHPPSPSACRNAARRGLAGLRGSSYCTQANTRRYTNGSKPRAGLTRTPVKMLSDALLPQLSNIMPSAFSHTYFDFGVVGAQGTSSFVSADPDACFWRAAS